MQKIGMSSLMRFYDRYWGCISHFLLSGNAQSPAATKTVQRWVTVWESREGPRLGEDGDVVSTGEETSFDLRNV